MKQGQFSDIVRCPFIVHSQFLFPLVPCFEVRTFGPHGCISVEPSDHGTCPRWLQTGSAKGQVASGLDSPVLEATPLTARYVFNNYSISSTNSDEQLKFETISITSDQPFGQQRFPAADSICSTSYFIAVSTISLASPGLCCALLVHVARRKTECRWSAEVSSARLALQRGWSRSTPPSSARARTSGLCTSPLPVDPAGYQPSDPHPNVLPQATPLIQIAFERNDIMFE